MRPFALLRFCGFYLGEVIRSNLRVALDVLRPRPAIEPLWVRLELPELPPGRLLLLSNLLTMTPGTLVADVSADGRSMLVHTLYGQAGAEALRREWTTLYVERIQHGR